MGIAEASSKRRVVGAWLLNNPSVSASWGIEKSGRGSDYGSVGLGAWAETKGRLLARRAFHRGAGMTNVASNGGCKKTWITKP